VTRSSWDTPDPTGSRTAARLRGISPTDGCMDRNEVVELADAKSSRNVRHAMRRASTVIGVLVLVVALTATSASAKTVPAAQWAPKFCAALSMLQAKLSSGGKKADAVLSGNITSLGQAKATLSSFMGKAVTDAEKVIAALKRAVTPEASNVTKLAGRFMSAFQTVRRLYLSAKSKTQHLATKSLAGFESATKKVTSDLNMGAARLTASFTTIRSLDTSGKIADALHSTPSCAFLQNA